MLSALAGAGPVWAADPVSSDSMSHMPLDWDGQGSIMEDEKANPVNIVQPTPFHKKKEAEAAKKERDKNEFVAAPIPFLNPSQGWGLALVGQYIFTVEDDASPPSVVAGGAFYTEKHSYGGALGYLGKVRNDQWRLGLLTGKAIIFYDFYGIGYDQNKEDISIPIRQTISFIGFRVMKQVGAKVFVGLDLVGAKIDTGIESDSNPFPEIEDLETSTDFISPNLKLERDTRNDSFYPTEGTLFGIAAEFHSEEFHDKTNYQVYSGYWNQYIGIGSFDVIAYRIMTRQSYGEVPFYSLSMFGQMGDLRGYETGKYRDKMMWAGQVEWRHRFTDHWGGVAFAGVGQLADEVKDFNGAAYLPSGGLGIRYRIADKNPVDFRFDTAYGDHKFSYYFSVGQAF